MEKDKIFYKDNFAHIQPVGATFFVTCWLKDAIPSSKLQSLKANNPTVRNNASQFNFIQELDNLLHANSGPAFLKAPEIARVLLARIESYHMRYYRLLALSIMPNHFHLIIDTSVQLAEVFEPQKASKDYMHIDKVMQLIKSGTSRYINQWQNTEGQQVWENETYDIYVRNEIMLAKAVNFIEENPVKAGLVPKKGEHPFTFVN